MSQTTWTEEERKNLAQLISWAVWKSHDAEDRWQLVFQCMGLDFDRTTREDFESALTRLMNRETGGGNG